MNEEMSYTMIAASAPRSNCEATHGSKAQPLSPQDDAQSNPNSSALGRWVKWEWWVKWEYWACTARSGVSQEKGAGSTGAITSTVWPASMRPALYRFR